MSQRGGVDQFERGRVKSSLIIPGNDDVIHIH